MDTATKPEPPVAYGDRTVSMIRAKYENRFTHRFNAGAEKALVEAISRASSDRFMRRKWLERHDAVDMGNTFAAIYAEAPFLLSARDEERAPTKVKPRSWAANRSRLHAAASQDERLVRLHAAQFKASRKTVAYTVKRTTHAWTFHAQERLHERTPTSVRADREIGAAVLDAVGMLEAMSDPTKGIRAPSRLAIPCSEGLLLGAFQDVPHGLEIARRVKADDVAFKQGRRTFGMQAEEETRDFGYARTKAFVGVTYVGPDEMRRDQVELRRRIGLAIADYRPLGEAISSSFTGAGIDQALPDAKGRMAEFEGWDALFARLAPGAAAKDALVRLLSDEAMLEAMGN